MIHAVGTRVTVEGLPGVVTDHEPASRVGDHSRHVVRLDDGSLVSTDADLVCSAEEAPIVGTVQLEPPRELPALDADLPAVES